MNPEPLFPPAVFAWWRAGLILTLLLLVPLSVYLLHGLLRTAASVERYARESLTAAGGIARNLEQLAALESTIQVATEMVALADGVAKKLDTVAQALAARAR